MSPLVGEDAALLAEDERLSNADALHAAAAAAHEALTGDPAAAAVDGTDALTLLGMAGRALEPVRPHDPVLAGLAERLSEAAYQVSDVAAELASYTESLDSDPVRLAAVQERRAALGRLVRAYGGVSGDVAGVLDWAKQASSRLTDLEGADDKITALAAEEASLASASDLPGLGTDRAAGGGGQAVRVGGDRRSLSTWPCRHASLTAVVTELDRPARSVPTTWSSGSPRIRARRRCRCTRALPAASCPASCSPSRSCSPARTPCRRSCSTRLTPGWAARPRSRWAGGWPGWRVLRR